MWIPITLSQILQREIKDSTWWWAENENERDKANVRILLLETILEKLLEETAKKARSN